MTKPLLHIYLNDHLAGASAGRELARRSLRNNRDDPDLAGFLEGLLRDIDRDLSALREIVHRVGARESKLKQSAGWALEKVGRLKLNGGLIRNSPLTRLIELEGLSLGVEGKLSLWRSLKEVAAATGSLEGIDLDELERRAVEQRDSLEMHRRAAARRALADQNPNSP